MYKLTVHASGTPEIVSPKKTAPLTVHLRALVDLLTELVLGVCESAPSAAKTRASKCAHDLSASADRIASSAEVYSDVHASE